MKEADGVAPQRQIGWWGFQSTSKIDCAGNPAGLQEKAIQHKSHRAIASTG
jgi:hypothetical protein